MITAGWFKQFGALMNNLLHTSIFASLEGDLSDAAEIISSAKVVQLMAPADIEGVLSLAQLESALLDNSKHYRRRVLPPRRNVSRDHVDELPEVEGLIVHIDPTHESQTKFEIGENYIHIVPREVKVTFSGSTKEHNGVAECVGICAAIAAIISPDGTRVRKQRPMAYSGSWLRGGADSNYDPVMSLLRDHLDKEGSIDIIPLPEVISPQVGMIPGFSKMMLNRLTKSWSNMDVKERSSAISELVLPSLRSDGISTMRIEELIWHRAIVSGCDVDIASQLYLETSKWPIEENEAKVHASSILDNLIINGHL